MCLLLYPWPTSLKTSYSILRMLYQRQFRVLKEEDANFKTYIFTGVYSNCTSIFLSACLIKFNSVKDLSFELIILSNLYSKEHELKIKERLIIIILIILRLK
jgi:hypothetical protein